jgi:hypothetical protein
MVQDDFLELNDLVGNQAQVIEEEMQIEQQQPIQEQQPMQVDLNLLAEEENLMQLADQEMQHIHVAQANVWPEEINPYELIGPDEDEDGFPNMDELVGPGEVGFPAEDGFQVNGNNPKQGVQMQDDQLAPDQHNMQMQPEVPGEQDHQQLNVGLALLNLPDADPVWAERSRNADATRLWANFFAQGNFESLHVSIPSQWANFFTVLLLSPDIYCWAKELITSKVLPLLRNNEGVVDFYIPKKCPKQISCKSVHDSRSEGDCKGKGVLWEANVDPAATPKKSSKKRSTSIVVDTDLRRSDRIKQVSGGSKETLALTESVLPVLLTHQPSHIRSSEHWVLSSAK